MKNLTSNGGFYLLEKSSSIIFALLIMMLISRTYGPENIGKLAFINSISGLLIILPTLGFDHFVVRDLVKKKEEGELLGTVFTCQVIGWLVYAVVLYFFVVFSDAGTDEIYLTGMVALTTLFTRLASVRLYFEAQQKPKIIAKMVISVRLIELLFVMILIYLHARYIFTATNILVQAFLLSVFVLFSYQKKGIGIENWRFSYDKAKALMMESWPFIISGFIFPIYMNIDVVMIKYFMDEYSVGIYSVAIRIITQISMLGTIFSSLLFPIIVRLKINHPQCYRDTVISSVSLVLVFSLVTVVFLVLSAKYLIPELFGNEFRPAIPVFNILSIALMFLWPAGIFTRLLVIEAATKIEMIKTLIAALMNVLLNILLIPKYGLEGAAIASVSAYFISDLLMYTLFRQTRWFFYAWCKSFLMIFVFWRVVKKLDHDLKI